MVGTGHHDRHAFQVGGPGQLPAHGEPVGHPCEPFPEFTGPLVEAVEVELEAQEERAAERVGGVLLRLGDVRAGLEQELGHGGDDARPVRAGDYQPADIGI